MKKNLFSCSFLGNIIFMLSAVLCGCNEAGTFSEKKYTPVYVYLSTTPYVGESSISDFVDYREDVEKSVVLVTGKVEVTASNGESVRILPNDRFRQSTDKYVVDKVNVEDYVSWKEGRLSFKNTELGGILKQLSRYYNVRIA